MGRAESEETTATDHEVPVERRTIAYQPALDGVRALAVLAVLLFHAEVAGFDGGYLGVSVFFTLSGFLITSLLAAETESAGSVALGSFYARRARRLLPASVLLVVLVVIAAAVTDWFDAVSDLRAHVVGSLLQIANWVFLAQDGSYQELLQQAAGAASPLEHYWSLAIEEQFYWLWPIAFVGLWKLGRSHRGRLWALGVVTVAFVAAAPIIAAVWGSDAAYWASPARAAEILVGAFVAVAIIGRRLDPRLWLLAPAALAALAVCIVTFPTAGGPAYAGWLPAIGAVSALLLLGLQVESPVRRACSIAPLVWLGKISYGVYLFHWPIFVVMNEERMGFDGVALLAVRLGVTLAVAQVSFLVYEQPIRKASRLTVRPTMAFAGVATAAVIGFAYIAVPGPASDYWSTDNEATAAAALGTDDAPLVALTTVPDETSSTGPETTLASGEGEPDVTVTSGETQGDTAEPGDAGEPAEAGGPPVTTSTLPPIPELSRPVRVIVAGDSTAEAIGAGIVNWAAFAPDVAQAELNIQKGCGFIRGGSYRVEDEWFEVRSACTNWLARDLPERIAEASPDVVMMMTTSFDVLDHRYDDDGEGADPATLRDTIKADFAQVTDEALFNGAGSVVWIKAPLPDPLWFSRGTDQEQPDRHAVLHSVMEEIAAERPGDVYVVDLIAYFDDAGLTDDVDARPDGVHLTPDAATDIVADHLGEQLVRAALDLL
ncbi:acyltransferase family protein [Ilumatobacter coccineus]|uniref:Putative acyltransferase n=1 Tax=Ilumatobacter coccineus (strain NBRC 103263 / KCTC 29153 / YM16-304) TaxID=1313172 RepID=A0A6C7EAC6_ILUCY|nr:acyltransferase family protein [Ilumatobacter coccineus]BAN03293.1 putative acyltransferase [Ilumatobacter coccineus YM16-304]